jgi:L-rhamnose mutarotase
MQRMAMVIHLKEEKKTEYLRLHAEPWPEILARISACNIRNYSIFLKEPENILFGYWEYRRRRFCGRCRPMAADPKTQEWWALTDPCQERFETAAEGEWWSMLELRYFIMTDTERCAALRDMLHWRGARRDARHGPAQFHAAARNHAADARKAAVRAGLSRLRAASTTLRMHTRRFWNGRACSPRRRPAMSGSASRTRS